MKYSFQIKVQIMVQVSNYGPTGTSQEVLTQWCEPFQALTPPWRNQHGEEGFTGKSKSPRPQMQTTSLDPNYPVLIRQYQSWTGSKEDPSINEASLLMTQSLNINIQTSRWLLGTLVWFYTHLFFFPWEVLVLRLSHSSFKVQVAHPFPKEYEKQLSSKGRTDEPPTHLQTASLPNRQQCHTRLLHTEGKRETSSSSSCYHFQSTF